MSSGQDSYQICEVWCRLDIACSCQCKRSNFLLPAGGALIIMEYSYLDVFRPGFLSNLWSLGQIRHCMAELQQLLFPWRDIEICDATMDTPISEISSSLQFNITKAFRLDWPIYYVDVIKSLGGVSYRVKHITSCCQQVALWIYMNMVT